MDLRQLGYFIQVCEAGSFSRAAAVLNLTQPTLSRQISLLEEYLGQRLFERTGRGVALTEAGHVLLPNARALLVLSQRTRDEIRDLQASPTGRVVLGLPPRLARGITVQLVQRFREQFPRASLTIQEGLSIHLREWLLSGRLDMALLFDPQSSPALFYQVFHREPLLLVGASDAKLPKTVSLETLSKYPLILPPAPNALRLLIDAVLRPHGIALNIVAEVGAAHTIIQLVYRKFGLTILPTGAVDTYKNEHDLQISRIGPPSISNSLVIATPLARPANRLTNAALQMMLALTRSNMRVN